MRCTSPLQKLTPVLQRTINPPNQYFAPDFQQNNCGLRWRLRR